MPIPRVRRLAVLAVAALVASTLAACSDSSDPEPKPKPSATSSATPSPSAAEKKLTFGVYGAPDEIAAYEAMARSYPNGDGPEVEVVPWASAQEAREALEGDEVPDVFLLSRRDLGTMLEEERLRPVDDLLDARGIDFADDYARDALRSFSAHERLQCMPYGVSPMVIYLNTDLIDFTKMAEQGLPAPRLDDEGRPPRQWSLEQFAAAADFATRPRRGTRGLSIEPTLRALTPFVLSGGGQIFDDEADPTSLALADDSSVDALERTLEILRDGRINLTQQQLRKRDAVEWFERGKVGMIAGFRDLVPRFRADAALNFDVMAMPVLDQGATVGNTSGLCLSADTDVVDDAADFLAYATSTDAVASVVREGYLMPANLTVAASDSFLQDGRRPANSRVFMQSVRDIYDSPLLTNWTEVEQIAARGIEELVTAPVLDRDAITTIAEGVDEESQLVLAPEPTASPSSNQSPSQSPEQGETQSSSPSPSS